MCEATDDSLGRSLGFLADLLDFLVDMTEIGDTRFHRMTRRGRKDRRLDWSLYKFESLDKGPGRGGGNELGVPRTMSTEQRALTLGGSPERSAKTVMAGL